MTADFKIPTPEEVGDFYDRTNRLITEYQGGSMHYGYWLGPGDDSDFERASDRFTDIMIDKLRVRPGQRVLDCGCGPGKPGVRLARVTGAEVIGISISAQDVVLANERAEREGMAAQARFQRANMLELPFPDNHFDHVLAFESIVHVPDRAAVLTEIARVLRPGGRVALTDFINKGTPSQDEEDRRALADALASWCSAPLVELDDYPGFAEAAGLVIDEITDVTENTKYTYPKTYGPMYEYARTHGEVPPEMARLLDAAPGEEAMKWVLREEPTEGVIIAVLHLPA
ncbi:methyltransferase domain-containing protein [Herbidospora galbida]|uniref:Methyltransferase domain-containing protein n=1 Tax=Herbidospora galbida TaxID=2575442 RepID=A0A4U3MFZ1_9ACTN|nr:methyltransferase domain-containing protein [Herbidospora galbida]TKK87224.1 methyltransferase domain-containing protein [Herbidospora galbida]